MSPTRNLDAIANPGGKSRSALNATKHGLYAAHDFVREGESGEYAQTRASLMNQLSPEGVLEETFATEIMSATWRLRRCRIVEADFSDQTTLDPMIDETVSKDQKSIDRARAQAHNILRKSMAELRKLQTERTVRTQLGDIEIFGLTDTGKAANALKTHETQRIANRKAEGLDTLEGLMAKADHDLCNRRREASETSEAKNGSFCNPPEPAPAAAETAPPQENSFCKPAAITPKWAKVTSRNANCPCRSGQKYKRCCGKDAAPALNIAA